MGESDDMSDTTIVGAILAIAASIFNAIGYTVQKKGHTRLKAFNKGKEDHEKKRLIKEKVWAMGFGIYLIGGVLNAVSLFYAPQSLVLPLSAITLVANTMLATKVLGEPFFKADIAGILCVVIGSILAVVYGPRTAGGEATMEELKRRWADAGYMTFFVVLSGCISLDYFIVRIFERKNAIDSNVTDSLIHGTTFLLISYCLLAGYFGSLAFLFLKSFTEFIGSSASSAAIAAMNASNWYSYFTLIGVVVTNFALEFFRQRGLSYFHAVYVVPINQGVLIVMGTVLGGIYFEEFRSMTSSDAALFVVAILLTVTGVFILAFNSGNVAEKTDAKINHTIHFSLEQNPAMRPLPVPQLIAASPAMPITRPLTAQIPDLPPPGIAGTIARIHGLQKSMATLQFTADGRPFYQDTNYDLFHLDTLNNAVVAPIGDTIISTFSTLETKTQRLRRGISDTAIGMGLHQKSESGKLPQQRGGPDLVVSSHSDRSLFRTADDDEFGRAHSRSTTANTQPEFITVRGASPSMERPSPTPNGADLKSLDLRIQNGNNHELEIELTDIVDPDDIEATADIVGQQRVPSPIDRTTTERPIEAPTPTHSSNQHSV